MATRTRVVPKVISLCKRHGFLFQTPKSVRGGNGVYTYGPLGAELKRNILNEWWYAVVTSTGNVHALESSLLTHPSMLDATSVTPGDHEAPVDAKETSNECSDSMTERSDLSGYDGLILRRDIQQSGLLHFLDCAKAMRLKIPFGIAETGKVFRSESSTNSLIAKKEHDVAGVQFFCAPGQQRQWCSHWQKKRLRWWKKFANHPEWIALGEGNESSSPDKQPSTIQFHFPWGIQDVESILKKGDTDFHRLSQTLQVNESSLKRARMENEKLFPSLISLAANMDSAVLAYLCDAYIETERSYGPNTDLSQHTVLKLHICLAPYKVAVLPLDETSEKLCMYCRKLTEELRHAGISTTYSHVGSSEYRIAVQDEIGTPYRVLADKKTLETGIVTMQDRDTTAMEEMNGCDVPHIIQRMLRGARLN